MFVTLVPAYGRDFKTAKAARESWRGGDDWRIDCMFCPDDGRYVSERDDCPQYRFTLRFDGGRKTAQP